MQDLLSAVHQIFTHADFQKCIAVLFTTLYTGLIYAIVYTFFESFPLVYATVYGFSPGSVGLCFLAVFVALLVVVPIYMLYIRYIVKNRSDRPETTPQEDVLKTGLLPCFITPVGLFVFGMVLPFRIL